MDRVDKAPADSPAIRLLDALRTGDDLGVLAVCGQTTAVSAANMDWSCRGRDEIHRMLAEARRRFPGITFESRTRHIGFGLVIDEARVQDRAGNDDAEDDAAAAERAAAAQATEEEARRQAAVPDPDIHPMWDEPVPEPGATSVRGVAPSGSAPPARLNLPVRVTVRHDDLQVHEITLSFPAALLKRALGLHVDPLEMSLSEVQSAFIAPVGAGFTTYTLAPPELPPAPPVPPSPQPWTPDENPPKRRRRLLVPALVALLAVVVAGGWWAVQGKDGNQVAEPPVRSPSSTPATRHSASPSPSHRPSSSKAPTVTHAKPSTSPHRKPNITLRSDLAFGFNSSSLSTEAKSAINDVAKQVRRARLTGTIYVDGYTDNIGSAAYGLVLSQRRADAVSKYLGSRLAGVRVEIKSIAHGEADPVADNSTNAGRKANRRVTITLPKP